MSKAELRTKLFDAVLEAAIREDFQRELTRIPDRAELERDCAPSAELNRKMAVLFKGARRRIFRQKFRRTAGRAVAAAVLLFAVSLGSLMSVEASRNAILNAVINWGEDRAEIVVREPENSSTQEAENGKVYQPTYLPDGFEEIKTLQLGPTLQTEYQNSDKVEIYFFQTPLSSTGAALVDTEHATYREIKINGKKAELFEANNSKSKSALLWQNSTNRFQLTSTIDSDELIRIAESVQ